jgi:hypothetical protein
MDFLNSLNPFSKPSAEKIAVTSLEEARRCLLEEQAKAEYHLKMAEYYKGVEKRLSAFVSNSEG